jgi:hypothetical protein
MTSNHDELERLARAAAAQTKPDEAEWFCREAIEMLSGNDEDAAFIAAANPATILALLSANREMREALETATDRVEFLEDNLLIIAERDRHYRSPPKPKPDGGLRGWAGHRAVWALTGQNGSFVGDDEVKTAVMEARSALTTQRGDGE